MKYTFITVELEDFTTSDGLITSSLTVLQGIAVAINQVSNVAKHHEH